MSLIDLEDIIIPELVKIYYNQEWWHSKKMEEEEAYKYHKKLLEDGNIIVYREDNILLGYVEYWRINFEQLGRIICKEHFSAYNEDVKSGNIAYLANIWIHSDYRDGSILKQLKMNFFLDNYCCKYFIGEALRKKTQPVKVFKREHLLKQGVSNG